MTTTERPHVPDVVLERFRLNELPAADATRLDARLRSDSALRSRLEALDASDREILARHPGGFLARRAVEQVAARRAVRRTSWLWPAGLAVAAVLLIATIPLTLWRDGDRIKGASLTIYRQTPQGTETIADGSVAHAGDVLRIGYKAAGRAFGMILSIDGRGVVTRHLPSSGERAATLQQNGMILLDTAYELDDAPRWERFYFITGDSPFEAAAVLEAARRAGGLASPSPPSLVVPRTLEQSTLTLQKEDRP